MKNKMVLLISMGALAFGSFAQNAMAGSTSANARRPAATKITKKVPSKAAVPSHTILPGVKHNY